MKRGLRQHDAAAAGAERRASAVLWGGMLFGGVLAMSLLLAPSCQQSSDETVLPVEFESPPPEAGEIALYEAQVVRRYPHDAGAFTQGLLWSDGALYESTGQYGRSKLRRVRLTDGRVLAERDLGPRFFGEGLARVDDELVQLTWREGTAIVSSLDDLREQRTMSYAGEGWGLCYDGESLVMSNGSATLTFRDPQTLDIRRHVTVRQDGTPVPRLNELECVDDRIYANVWMREDILEVDPATGNVVGLIDAGGLLSPEEAAAADVLNGIAYRPESGTFLITGKYWPTVFEVELVSR